MCPNIIMLRHNDSGNFVSSRHGATFPTLTRSRWLLIDSRTWNRKSRQILGEMMCVFVFDVNLFSDQGCYYSCKPFKGNISVWLSCFLWYVCCAHAADITTVALLTSMAQTTQQTMCHVRRNRQRRNMYQVRERVDVWKAWGWCDVSGM